MTTNISSDESSFLEEPEAVKTADLMSKEEFSQAFCEMFNFAGDIAKIEKLKINNDNALEVSGANATANSLYRLASKYKPLRFLISNESTFFGDIFLIGWFAKLKIGAVIENKGVMSKWQSFKHKAKGLAYLARAGAVKQPKQEK